MTAILGTLAGRIGAALLALAVLGGIYWELTSAAYDRGMAARDKEAREIIQRMEDRLAQRMKNNEGKTDDEIDCALKRLRNPKAECGK